MRHRLALLGLGLLVLVVSTSPAEAIPAFARKYEFSCSTCHAPFPRLKPYGEEFAARGFRLEDPAQEPTRAARDVGDPLLWLPRDVPLAIRMDGYASWKEDAEAEADFEFPWQFKILAGGPITKSMAYYVYAIFEKGESVKLEDAWMQFSSNLRRPDRPHVRPVPGVRPALQARAQARAIRLPNFQDPGRGRLVRPDLRSRAGLHGPPSRVRPVGNTRVHL